MKKFYKTLKNALLSAISYKFKLQLEIHETLTGIGSKPRSAAKELSRIVALESQLSVIEEVEVNSLQYALMNSGYE